PAPKAPPKPPVAPVAAAPAKPEMPAVIAPGPAPGPAPALAPAAAAPVHADRESPPVAVHPAPPAAPPPPPVMVRVTEDAWISVIDAHGTPVFSRLMHAGETWIPPRPGLLLTTGNAGGTVLVLNGVAGKPLGPKGSVLHAIPLAPKPANTP
ncbi:MAG: DUF4115 domain-containing protein, partial [Rhodospirillales bacterium]|nr:DUF4115 domain-containing protein [Rhodospirillales bacterium]